MTYHINYVSAGDDDMKLRETRVTLPTARLPPIRLFNTNSLSVQQVISVLKYLSELYDEPEVRGVRYIRRTQRILSRHPKAENEHDSREESWPMLRGTQAPEPETESDRGHERELERVRADVFERTYAIRWLTALVSHTGQPHEQGITPIDAPLKWETVVQQAARLLAVCAGAAAAGVRCRTFAFRTSGAKGAAGRSTAVQELKIHITDLPLDNQDYSSMGAQTWGGGCLLADMIAGSSSDLNFGLSLRPGGEKADQIRVLELGAGTGLVSITVGKLLEARGVSAEVVATDFHSEVLKNLKRNITDNFPSNPLNDGDSAIISFSVQFLDWAAFPSSNPHFTSRDQRKDSNKDRTGAEQESPLNDVFDVIYGADVVYEIEHARWIKACVELLLRMPESNSTLSSASTASASTNTIPCFHLVIPLRTTHIAESRSVEDVFPFADEVEVGADSKIRRGVLAITAKEEILCGDMWAEGSKEVEYVYYTIAWV